MKTVIVIPTYNEQENIGRLLNRIFSLGIADLEVIVVDDSSPDGTANLVRQSSPQEKIHLLERSTKSGLGSAYIAGFKKALEIGADYIFEMDADLSHDPDDIPRLLSAASNADLAIGSRRISGGQIIGWGWNRKMMSRGAMWLSRLALGLKTQDVTSGFRCYRRSVLSSLNLEAIKSNGYAFQEELLFLIEKGGYNVKEVPVTFVDRRVGQSKLSPQDILEFFFIIYKLKKYGH
ncbi:MAG TPA: polyprenol monophosphomannose synthase [Patescibacteria group bacterium]|nr:polyprenol monophosphomannose synthase [Patescibacteria group bacterium]